VNVSRTRALALDADALEDLDAAARALDHLKVDAQRVTGLETGTWRSCSASSSWITFMCSVFRSDVDCPAC
jgi:hypothetical protein